MENGHVKIHDPISNDDNLPSSTDPTSASDTDTMRGTVERRLMMAYTTRRRPKTDFELCTQDSPMVPNGGTDTNGPPSPKMLDLTEKEEKKEGEKKKKKKKKKGWKKRLPIIFRCLKPQTVDQEPFQTSVNSLTDVNARGFVPDKEVEKKDEKDKLEEVASRLTEIADDIEFVYPEIETDSKDEIVPDDVEKVIGLILRDAGDRLNQEELNKAFRDSDIFWNYSFFRTLITTLLRRMGLVPSDPESLGPQASPKTQIAVTCEVTSRLSAVDTLPMNRMLDHGARYLHEYYSSWVQQQGGYDEAFYSEDEDDQ